MSDQLTGRDLIKLAALAVLEAGSCDAMAAAKVEVWTADANGKCIGYAATGAVHV